MKKITTLLVALLAIFALNLQGQNAWINEIHYDNTGGDTNEGIEVAGRAGIDLSAYWVYPYDGDGTFETQKVKQLSGIVPKHQVSYGTVWCDGFLLGLENEQEGLALIHIAGSQTNVIQFLSYEGSSSLTAADGPAKGFIAEDIDVKEPGPIDTSLQLIGSGNAYADFTWTGPIQHTRGAINTGQTFVPVPTLLLLR